MSNLTQTNKQIQSLDIQGDIVPQIWYNHIKYKTEKGKTKTDLLAIAILANTVYWYRPTEIRDEATNKVVGYKKKFESDMLQRSYGQLGNFYGKTKREVKSSIALLVDLNLIKIEFRSLYVRGVLHNNVMFIDLIVDEIKKISMVDDMIYTPPTKKRNSLLQKKDRDYTENLSEPPTEIGNTNTKNISKTTTETNQKKEDSLSYMNLKSKFAEKLKAKNIRYIESRKEYGSISLMQELKIEPQEILDMVDILETVKKNNPNDKFLQGICFTMSHLVSYRANIYNAQNTQSANKEYSELDKLVLGIK